MIDWVCFYTTHRQYFNLITATAINKRWSFVKFWNFSGGHRESTLHRYLLRTNGVVIFDTGHHLTSNPTDICRCTLYIYLYQVIEHGVLEYDSLLTNRVELTHILGLIHLNCILYVCMYKKLLFDGTRLFLNVTDHWYAESILMSCFKFLNYQMGVNTKFTTWCKFCINSHPINSKFTTWN